MGGGEEEDTARTPAEVSIASRHQRGIYYYYKRQVLEKITILDTSGISCAKYMKSTFAAMHLLLKVRPMVCLRLLRERIELAPAPAWRRRRKEEES